MIRAVIDTNLWISALIRPQGVSSVLLRHLRAGEFAPVFSESLLAELVETLSEPRLRDVYGVRAEDVQTLVDALRLSGELVMPSRKVQICRDPDDDAIIEAALAGNVVMVVTGDKDLLTLDEFETVRFISLREFLTQLT